MKQIKDQKTEINWIRTKLIRAESSGFTNKTQEEILALSKQMLQKNL